MIIFLGWIGPLCEFEFNDLKYRKYYIVYIIIYLYLIDIHGAFTEIIKYLNYYSMIIQIMMMEVKIFIINEKKWREFILNLINECVAKPSIPTQILNTRCKWFTILMTTRIVVWKGEF